MLAYHFTLTLFTFALAVHAQYTSMGNTNSAPSPPAAYPIIAANFADPTFIKVDGCWIAMSTNNGKMNVPVAKSPDGDITKLTVQESVDALPVVGAWVHKADDGDVGDHALWAPDVLQLVGEDHLQVYVVHFHILMLRFLQPDGSFVLYYSAVSARAPGTHCVGTATATNVLGPYAPGDNPLACWPERGGAIDADGFIDTDGSIWITYKIDGNNPVNGKRYKDPTTQQDSTPIMLQKMQADGVTPIRTPTQILDRSEHDGPLVEATTLVRSAEGTYFLFFSSNAYNTHWYDVSYATAPAITGPYTKTSTPLLVSYAGAANENLSNVGSGFGQPVQARPQGALVGPGHADVSTDGKTLVFHAIQTDEPLVRAMYAAEISLSGTTVMLVRPLNPA